jgi:flagellar motor switch protein FliM
VPTRAATRTDAAMVAPLVDLMLAGYDAEMATGPAGYGPRGFRFGDRVEDARALALLLPAPEFDLFRLTVDLGPGVRTGRLDLLLPPAPPTPSTRPGDPPHAAPSRTEGPDLAAATLSAPVALQVMLARVTLSLRAAMALAPGTRLSLPKDSIGTAQLVGTGGHVLAEGRLGQRDGWRALRLLGPTAEGAPSVAPPAPPLPEPDPARVPAIASGTD